MRFELDAAPNPGIRVIPLIPDIAMCRIEGQNGVGKTLAVRLLQLCTGEQPYSAMTAAWSNLKEHLGDVTIRATALQGAEVIEWRLDPDRWPDDPVAVEGEWLGDISIDGTPANLSRVQTLLSVLRIAGDETLPETIAHRMSEHAFLVGRAHRDMGPTISRLDKRLEELSNDLTRVNVERLTSAKGDLKAASETLAHLERDYDEVSKRLDSLERARRLQNAIESIRRDAPELQAELERLDAEIGNARANRKRLETEADRLRPQQDQRNRLALQYEEQQIVVNRRLGNFERTKERVRRLATELEVDPGRSTVEAAEDEDRQLLEELTQERAKLDATPAIQQLARDVGAPLSRAADQGLGHHEIAEMEPGKLTVSQLAEGVERRRRSLAALPMPATVRRLDERIDKLKNRLEKLGELLKLLRRAESNRRSLAEAQEELDHIGADLSGADAERYKLVADELSEARNVEVDLSYRRADTVRQLGQLGEGRSLEDISSELAAVLKDIGVRVEQLDEELSSAGQRAASLQESITQTSARADSAQATVLDQLSSLRLVVNLFEHGSGYEWIRSAIGDQIPAAVLSEDDNIARVKRLQIAVDGVRERISGLHDEVLAVSFALQELALLVTGRRQEPSGTRFIEELRSYYQGLLTKEFNNPDIATALFDGGSFERLNLSNLSVIWKDQEERTHTRPLEAFSSGERAFAYTLARLVSTDPMQAANRLLVLDEFGAYVARERLAQLVSILESRILGKTAEQVVVILPLSQDYDRPTPAGSRASDGQERAQQVAERGYFADTFDIVQ